MRPLSRTLATLALAGIFACAIAERAFIDVSAFPTRSVADGRSTVTISATVRNPDGRTVPDGTRVRFNTTLGNFREQIVTTVGGVARATLVAGGIPGTAQITASGMGIDAPPNTFEYEFVGSRSDLSSANEYIEIVAPTNLEYASDSRTIGASGVDRGAFLRYRDVQIRADDLQYDVDRNEVRARKAQLKIGRWTKDFEDLYLRLTARKGVGITTFRAKRWNTLTATGRWFSFFRVDDQGRRTLPQEEERFGVVDVKSGSVTPSTTPMNARGYFDFKDLRLSRSLVAAKKVVVYPRRQIQFASAEMLVDGARVMKVPLFQLSLTDSRKTLITDQFVNVNDNQISVNYPHYLTLKPGQTSLLRFRTGGTSGRGTNGTHGIFLDYEMKWNRGDEMQGGLTLEGIARDDWVVALRHSMRLDDRTDMSAAIDLPQGQSIYGSANVSRQFTGFTATANANATRTFRGLEFRREDYSLNVDKDPIKMGTLPVRLTYGFDAQTSRLTTPYASAIQTTYGLGMRLQSNAIAIDSTTNLSFSASARKILTNNDFQGDGVTLAASLSLSKSMGPASIVATYDFLKDGFADQVDGQHRVSMQGYYNAGNTRIGINASRSLDIDHLSLYGDLSYRFASDWRLSYGYTFDRFIGESYFDTSIGLGYRIGYREVGLIWSRRTNRIGVQLLGAQF